MKVSIMLLLQNQVTMMMTTIKRIDEYALSDTESSDEEMFAFDEKNRASSSVVTQ